MGRNVSYQCIVNDTTDPVTGITAWFGSAFQCSDMSNRIILQNIKFQELTKGTCGGLEAMAIGVNGSIYISQLRFAATRELNGATISCSQSSLTDNIIIGGQYVHSKTLSH